MCKYYTKTGLLLNINDFLVLYERRTLEYDVII